MIGAKRPAPFEPLPAKSRNPRRAWPPWAQVLMTLALLYHMVAIVSASLASHPSSMVERRVAKAFSAYNDLTNQGFSYRFYAKLDNTTDPHQPRPWGTPVVTAEMEFEAPDGRKTTESMRLPGQSGLWPRLRHQRQLDLAYHLTADPRWAASYARHLCVTRGCTQVALYTQEHHIPDLVKVREAAARGDLGSIDLDDPSTYTPRVKLGEFRCTDF